MSSDAASVAAPEVPEAECPICGTVVPAFDAFSGGNKPTQTPDRKCPGCGSLERHRLMWLFFQARTNLFTKKVRMLHFAPEACLAKRLRARKNIHYLTADLAPGAAMVEMDITDIKFPDQSFDVICASHVLEHIPDDRRAMQELHRVLRRGGWAVLQVPMWGDTTLEDPSVTDPDERARLYGQFDHVRMYGNDGEYERRLRESGFEVDAVAYANEIPREKVKRYRVKGRENIWYCTKPGRPSLGVKLRDVLR